MTPANADSMICLLVGEAHASTSGRRELTVVCNERTEAIAQVVHDLAASFEDFEDFAEIQRPAA